MIVNISWYAVLREKLAVTWRRCELNKPISSDGTVGKALEVLDQVAQVGRPVRFSELLQDSPHPKATLYRLLHTLIRQKMLSYDDERQTYWLGLKLVQLAHVAWRQSSLATISTRILDELAAATNETVHLAQMDSGQVLFVDKKRVSYNFETLAQVGLIAPAHCTGVGKAILAFLSPARLERAMKQQTFLRYTPNTHGSRAQLETELETIRREGIAFDREEHETGVISIAAPVLRQNGQPLGAVSIVSTISRHSSQSLSEFQPLLLKAVKQISVEADAWNFPQAV